MKNIFWLLRFSTPSFCFGLIGGIFLILAGISVYAVPLILKYLFDEVIPKKDFNEVVIISIILLLIYLIKSTLTLLGNYMSNRYAQETLGNIQQKALERVLLFNADIFEKYDGGDLSARITSDIYILRSIMLETLLSYVKNVIIVIAGLLFIYFLYPVIAIIVGVCLGFNYIFLYHINKYTLKRSREVRNIIGELTGKIMEAINAFLLIKVYLLENFFVKRVNNIIQSFVEKRLSLDIVRNIYRETNSFFSSALMVLVILLLSFRAINNDFSVGSIVSLVFFMQIITSAFSGISNFSISFAEAKAAFQRITTLFLLNDYHGCNDLERGLNGTIKITDLTFAYNNNNKSHEVLKNVNLIIKKGEKIAIVGESGSGKSTLVKILLKLYSNYEGDIYFDDVSLSEISSEEIRRGVTFVPQEDFIFNDTIWMNVKIVDDSAGDKAVEEAVNKARLNGFINKYGRNYFVGWKGDKISGGEKQRIALARAFLKNSPILIIDEATSQVDSISEFKIRHAMQELWRNKTTIVIAHRLSTVLQMDRIIVIKNGKILAEGAHNELFDQCSYYRKICRTQYIDKNSGGISHDEVNSLLQA